VADTHSPIVAQLVHSLSAGPRTFADLAADAGVREGTVRTSVARKPNLFAIDRHCQPVLVRLLDTALV
jgi:hypothetical protein